MWWQFRATVMTLWRWTKWKSKQLLQVSCGAGLHKELLTELEIASANLNRKLYDANWPRDFACVVLLVVADHCMSSLFSSLQEQGLPPLPIPPNPSFSSSFDSKFCFFFFRCTESQFWADYSHLASLFSIWEYLDLWKNMTPIWIPHLSCLPHFWKDHRQRKK